MQGPIDKEVQNKALLALSFEDVLSFWKKMQLPSLYRENITREYQRIPVELVGEVFRRL